MKGGIISSCMSATLRGVEARCVTIETSVSAGMSAFTIVGMADTRVQEARERIRCALKQAGVPFPYNMRITCNMAPADVKKEGTGFDLAIALTLASAVLHVELPRDTLFLGELGLDGSVRAVRGVMPAIRAAQVRGVKTVVIPEHDAQLISAHSPEISVLAATSLADVIAHILGKQPLPLVETTNAVQTAEPIVDLADIFGNEMPKRALEIAAAGRHHLLMCGPPGTGKTMLASAITGIMAPLTQSERTDVACVYSAYGTHDQTRWSSTEPPLRAPHHSISAHALIGGGTPVRPGEISLAHRGVLFLDELPEFSPSVRELLRQPLESGTITVARAGETFQFPARFQLVGAYNPCPCGFAGDPKISCRCMAADILRYERKLSGPLMDRIDLFVTVPRTEPTALTDELAQHGETSISVRKRIVCAQKFAQSHDALGTIAEIRTHLEPAALQLLQSAATSLSLSPRALLRTTRVARTIADLALQEKISAMHVAEALQFRPPTTHAGGLISHT